MLRIMAGAEVRYFDSLVVESEEEEAKSKEKAENIINRIKFKLGSSGGDEDGFSGIES